ncbi:MAG: nucleotidyltransferase domain-containing protein [Gammaproteobacteria bacterium]|nr:nucleotidyltransferase domain-containing protein [Gammaproteobacteria bacterium]MBU1725752.1 nucleotidyltransferase domain-containing protein [Gammaproteobacteria bacterium]MBU2006936.1 nucleotidyltransferase domain-containing protein [Gammaproteobacteria bacterium]
MPANQRTLSIPELRALLSAFKQQHGAEYSLRALGYFGSYAHNTATPDSDVDIVFETDNPNLFLTAMMKQDLEEVLGRPVDVLHLRGLQNSRLKERIEKEAVYV